MFNSERSEGALRAARVYIPLGRSVVKKKLPDRPTDRPTIHPSIHPEKVIDLRAYFPQIFETDQHFSVDFSCKIEGILKPTNIFLGISLVKLKVILM